MASTRTDPEVVPRKTSGSLSRRVRLLALAHLEAMCAAPRAYLIASWWHLRGKRLRARAQFAPLLGASAQAYRLWLLQEKPVADPHDHPDGATSTMVALIDATQGASPLDKTALDRTLRSLEAEGVTALVMSVEDSSRSGEALWRIDGPDGLWLMPIAAGDVLAPGAAAAYRSRIAGSNARILYADDDLLDADGVRTRPHFKPGWNSELFRGFDYLTGACLVHLSPLDREGLSEIDDPSRIVETMVARVAADCADVPPIEHIPKILHHRVTRPGPRVPAATAITARGLPAVSVIVPTRNRLDLLRTCLDGLARTDYPDLDVIVVDNESDDPAVLSYLAGLDPARHRVLRHAGAFNFSAINNRAVAMARAPLLCLLNNDIEVIEPDWLTTLAAQAVREDVGAVGARLLYPDGRIQHAGVVLGIGGGAAHAHRLLHPDEDGYFRRHALPQFVSAVTAACLVVKREHFLAVGGFDEENFAVAFNDVDLCMRLNRRGWRNLYEPRATLIHHESLSRGLDHDPVGAARLAGELAALKRLWGTGDRVDPFHHPELSPFSERFVVRV